MLTPLKVSDVNTFNGIMGVGLRLSTITKLTRRIAPNATEPRTTGLAHPRSDAELRPYTSDPSPKNASAAPGPSRPFLASGSMLSGTWRKAMRMVGTAMIGLMRKIARHDMWSTSQPPNRGPPPAAIADAPDQMPIAAPRSFSPNAAPMMANEHGINSAAPTP